MYISIYIYQIYIYIYTLIFVANRILLALKTSKFKSQIRLLICITNQVYSHCNAEIATEKAAEAPKKQKVPIRCPHQNRHVGRFSESSMRFFIFPRTA